MPNEMMGLFVFMIKNPIDCQGLWSMSWYKVKRSKTQPKIFE